MNVLELPVFTIATALLFGFGRALFKHFGIESWIAPFIVPAGLWLFAAYGVIRGTYGDIKNSLSRRPTCQTGKCTSRQYVLVESRSDGALFRCRCGDLYLASGPSFLRILPDNSKQLYMVRSSSGDWEAQR